MGLDVYLYHIDDVEKRDSLVAQFEAECEQLDAVMDWDTATKEEKDTYFLKRKEVANKLGLTGEWESYPGEVKIEENSAIDPDHYFKVGYFRSSYNSSGVDRKLRLVGVDTLSQMFQVGDRYEFKPDWDYAKQRCEEAIKAVQALVDSPMGKFDVMKIDSNTFISDADKPRSGKEALEIFSNEFLRHTGKSQWFDSYSSRTGDFFMSGITVHGFIQGISSFMEQPCQYIIYSQEESPYKWYLTALQIVMETIEFALNHEEKDKLYLHWSS